MVPGSNGGAPATVRTAANSGCLSAKLVMWSAYFEGPAAARRSEWHAEQACSLAAEMLMRPRCSVLHSAQESTSRLARWCIGPSWQERQAPFETAAENSPAFRRWHVAHSFSRTAWGSLRRPLE